MILSSENTTADNGTPIHSTVDLRIENIGVVERPFFVKVMVDHSNVFHAYKSTEAEAKECRKKMHAAYMEAHSTAKHCFCPDDCNCHHPHRTNYCGCKQH